MGTNETVMNFKESIRARRSLLQFLFENALKNWKYVQAQTKGSEEVTAAQWMSQDCANALVLIVGYSLERFLATVSGGPLKRPTLHDALKKLGGDAYSGVKLGSAIVAIGDLARHLQEPQAQNPLRGPTKHVLSALCLGEKHDQAAVQFLENLEKNNPTFQSYADFEAGLLAIADDV